MENIVLERGYELRNFKTGSELLKQKPILRGKVSNIVRRYCGMFFWPRQKSHFKPIVVDLPFTTFKY